jgi:hypothetical protein
MSQQKQEKFSLRKSNTFCFVFVFHFTPKKEIQLKNASPTYGIRGNGLA